MPLHKAKEDYKPEKKVAGPYLLHINCKHVSKIDNISKMHPFPMF